MSKKTAKKSVMYGYLLPQRGKPPVWMHDDEEIMGSVFGPTYEFEFFIHANGLGILNIISPGGMRIDRILIKNGRFVQELEGSK